MSSDGLTMRFALTAFAALLLLFGAVACAKRQKAPERMGNESSGSRGSMMSDMGQMPMMGMRGLQACVMCHGEHGDHPKFDFIPRLAAQTIPYLTEQLRAFRDGSRADPPPPELSGMRQMMWDMMPRVASSLSDSEIEQAAQRYAAEPPPSPIPAEGSLNLARGIFRHGLPQKGVPACSSCHGSRAQGQGIYPRLAGQNPFYLLIQLHYFKNGLRRDKRAAIMQHIAKSLTGKEMHALAEYLASL